MSTKAVPRPAVGPLRKMIKKMPPQLILLRVGRRPGAQGLATTQLQSGRRRLDYSDFSSPSVPSPLRSSSSAASKSALCPLCVCASPATKPSGSSRSADVGIRSGWDQTESRPSIPRASRSAAHKLAASRIRRGRNSRPTSVANVSSAGPPVARARRTASAKAGAEGIRSAVACVTTSSTQPSTRASIVSNRS